MLANKAAAIAIGKPYPVRSVVTLEPAALDAFAGQYRMAATLNRTIRRDGANLEMLRPGRAAVTLFPFAPNEFFSHDATTIYRFTRSASGAPGALVLVDEDRETVNERM